MATVRITDNLIQSVRDVIAKLESEERERECPTYGDSLQNQDASELFNAIMWGDHVNVLKQLPRKWLMSTQDNNIYVMKDENTCVANVRFNSMKSAFYRPKGDKDNIYSAVRCELPLADLYREDLRAMPGWEHLKAQVDMALKIDELEATWEEARKKVTGYLSACKSVNEAVKGWPGVKFYLPEHVIQRIGAANEVSEELKAAELKRQADKAAMLADAEALESLTAIGVGAMLLKGGSGGLL